MSLPLLPAVLLRLCEGPTKKGAPQRVLVDESARNKGVYPVQFNPTSLKLSRTNNIDKGGATVRTQAKQNPSAQSATLSFDLEYDTAEEEDPGAKGKPVDVRTKTRDVRQFVEPPEAPADAGKPPPRVRFVWGTFTFTGIVSQLTEDLDYFSPDGHPLRAKLSITITEQNLKFEGGFAGAAARQRPNATPPGGAAAAAGPNAPPARNPDQAALAQDGESLQQLLTRLGLDPAAWRAAMADLTSPLTLAAGAQVQLSASATVSAGLGATAGFAAEAQLGGAASLGAALGVSASAGLSAGASAGFSAGASAGFSAGASAGLSAGASAGLSGGASAGAGLQVSAGAQAGVSARAAAGFALAEGGGIQASANAVAVVQATAVVDRARAAFSVPGGAGAGASVSAGASASVGASASAGVSAAGTVTVSRRRAVAVDPRTQSYGHAIPLRSRPRIVG
jgi:hypothetical protein